MGEPATLRLAAASSTPYRVFAGFEEIAEEPPELKGGCIAQEGAPKDRAVLADRLHRNRALLELSMGLEEFTD
jgi:hypothetical protein